LRAIRQQFRRAIGFASPPVRFRNGNFIVNGRQGARADGTLPNSTVTVTMRYTHSNLDFKVAAVGKLLGGCWNLATPCTKLQQSPRKVSQIGR
jgi:hypothetical protein